MKSELKAGTVHISTKESGLNLYQHQRDAIYELNRQVIEADKNPFCGMVVLPTGGGKTLTAGYWICQNYLDKGKNN